MKSTNIFLLSFIILISGCSLYERLIDNNTYVSSAGYNKWSKPPLKSGAVPEKGVDLAVIVKNWPEGADPSYIVHENWKALNANITSTMNDRTVINARVIKASSVRNRTSNQVDEGDRLVYTDAKGKEKYIKIEDWTRLENSDDADIMQSN